MDGPTPWRSLETRATGDDPPADALATGALPPRAALAAVGVAVAGIALAGALLALRLGSISGPAGDPTPGASDDLVVEVAGAVLRPGLYHVPAGSRVADAIAAAGGYSPRIDVAVAERQVDLAAEVADGDRILVPARINAPDGSGAAPGADADHPDRVDLNRATQAELEALPGIGPVTAKKIIDARSERPFASAEELVERKVVGRATFEKLRDLVVPTS